MLCFQIPVAYIPIVWEHLFPIEYVILTLCFSRCLENIWLEIPVVSPGMFPDVCYR